MISCTILNKVRETGFLNAGSADFFVRNRTFGVSPPTLHHHEWKNPTPKSL